MAASSLGSLLPITRPLRSIFRKPDGRSSCRPWGEVPGTGLSAGPGKLASGCSSLRSLSERAGGGQQVHFDGDAQLQVVAGHLQGEGMRGESAGGELTRLQEADFARTPAEIGGIYDQDAARFFRTIFSKKFSGTMPASMQQASMRPVSFRTSRDPTPSSPRAVFPTPRRRGWLPRIFLSCARKRFPLQGLRGR